MGGETLHLAIRRAIGVCSESAVVVGGGLGQACESNRERSLCHRYGLFAVGDGGRGRCAVANTHLRHGRGVEVEVDAIGVNRAANSGAVTGLVGDGGTGGHRGRGSTLDAAHGSISIASPRKTTGLSIS